MTATTAEHLIAARRADSDRRRQKVLNALAQLRANDAEITVSAVARAALLTELGRESPQFNGHVSDLGATVSARDRRW